MRIAPDTNTIVSGLLWNGPSHEILQHARAGDLALFTTQPLLTELLRVLAYPRLQFKVGLTGLAPEELLRIYAHVAIPVAPAPLDPVILADPDDDALLACAVAAGVDAIVSGDRHLRELGAFRGIPILSATALLARLSQPRAE